ncbi:O-antigen ligase family protein [Selenomonas ruminantium]|uniref:O-antigen ligase family protein n=1 Tax=Selenomonas ruminantium TaxID=971 RepID=UPI001B7F8233|nr:hypothetical protein [Selenomonas ruminantium]
MIFWVECIKKEFIVSQLEGEGLLLLMFPIISFGMIQCLLLKDSSILIRCIGAFANIITACCISKSIGFLKFSSILRKLTLINIIIVLTVVFCGTLEIDVSNMDKGEVFYLSWGIFKISVVPGSWSGIDIVRSGGLFGHPNLFGLMSAIGIIGLAYEKKDYRMKWLWWIVFVISFIISESRASILFVMTFYLFNNVLSNDSVTSKKIKIILMLLLFVFLGIILVSLRSNDTSDITSGRMDIWELVYSIYNSGLDINMLFGIGIGKSSEYLTLVTGSFIPVDNSYIPLLLEMGIIGLGMWLSVLILFFFYASSIGTWRMHVSFLAGVIAYSFLEHELSLDLYSLHWLVYYLTLLSIQEKKNTLFY